MAEPPVPVTPAGIRSGDRATAEALTARRGAAVLAYCERVAAPGQAQTAAAEAFTRFRAAVIATPDSDGVDPEILLLSATRHAAARHAPRPALAGVAARLGAGRRGPQACALVPELLAARAEGALTDADRLRLSRHLQRCQTCEAAQQRFSAAEAAYHNPTDRPPSGQVSAAIVAALTARGPGRPDADAGTDSAGSKDPGERLAAVLAMPIAAEPEADPAVPRRAGEPAGADPGPTWPDESQFVTAARIAPVATPVAAGVVATEREGAAVALDDDARGEITALQSTLGHPVEVEPLGAAESELFDDDEDDGHGPGRLPPPPRRFGRHAAAEVGADDLAPVGAAAAVHPFSSSSRRRPPWALLLPLAVVLVAIFIGLALAGVFHGSHAHAAARPLPAAVTPTPTPAPRHHVRRHHHHHHVSASATAAASSAGVASPTATASTPPTPTSLAPRDGDDTSSSSPSAPTKSTGTSPSPAAPTASAPTTPTAGSGPATSLQSGGSSTAAPPAGGGAPASGTPSATFQPAGG